MDLMVRASSSLAGRTLIESEPSSVKKNLVGIRGSRQRASAALARYAGVGLSQPGADRLPGRVEEVVVGAFGRKQSSARAVPIHREDASDSGRRQVTRERDPEAIGREDRLAVAVTPRQTPLVRAICAHDIDLPNAVAARVCAAHIDDASATGREVGGGDAARIVRQLTSMASVRPHHEDLWVTVDRGDERDSMAVGREGGRLGGCSQKPLMTSVGPHDPDAVLDMIRACRARERDRVTARGECGLAVVQG